MSSIDSPSSGTRLATPSATKKHRQSLLPAWAIDQLRCENPGSTRAALTKAPCLAGCRRARPASAFTPLASKPLFLRFWRQKYKRFPEKYIVKEPICDFTQLKAGRDRRREEIRK
ncbi:hypothetical protein MesoLjLc_36270 [Mesorhizobium sp. L-8-10]|nr:hypothetical protein MesoLjLc_36270 [Mesorhizobium sp. L-8-10]